MSNYVYKPSGNIKGIDDRALKPTYKPQVSDNQNKKSKEIYTNGNKKS